MRVSAASAVAGRSPRAGLTLVEVVIALAILGTSLFVLIEATARCLAVIRQSRHYQTARAALGRGEAEYPLRATNSVEDNTVAPVEVLPGYTFERDIEETDGEEHLYRVVTRIAWSDTGGKAFEEMVSYLYSTSEE